MPNAHERELLIILIEECAEVEVQPGQPFTNSYRLAAEVGDLFVMVDLLKAAGLVGEHEIEEGKYHKRAQLARFMQTHPRALHQDSPNG